MRIIVETGSGADGQALRAMFEDRKRVFVDCLKWDVPVLEDRFEIDQFDDRHATYLIVADEHGDHLGSARLLPTIQPHILGSLFPYLCAGPPPTGVHIFEITRFCLSPRHNAKRRRFTRNRLVSGLVAHALQCGIRTYTGVAELAWLQQILAFGWDCRPLGAPAVVKRSMIGALAIHIESDTPDLLAANGMWDPAGSQLHRLAEAA